MVDDASVETRLNIERLSHTGAGIAHINGKTVFVDGALPGETADVRIVHRHRRFDNATAKTIYNPSAARVRPKCPHYGQCGGCCLQHMDSVAQIEFKQSLLLELLEKDAGVRPRHLLQPLTSKPYAYRHKARLGVKYVEKKGGILLGFREKAHHFIADIHRCEVLHVPIGDQLLNLRRLIGKLSIARQIPQLEIAIAENATACVLRHLAPLNDTDIAHLRSFEQAAKLEFYLQSAGMESIQRLPGAIATTPLHYRIDNDTIVMEFGPADFTQINFCINRKMTAQSIQLLQTQKDDRVLELYCGIGNLSLPIARRVHKLQGMEGSAALVERARFNAMRNGIENAAFAIADLESAAAPEICNQHQYNKLILDPPRNGAKQLLCNLDLSKTERVVYVSCNPSTLARDTTVLTAQHGFQIDSVGVMDMFPHTSHVESIALFTRAPA